MSKFNNIDNTNWKESELITDSLWLFPTRDNSGKHEGSYHGNFIPQIATQLILRYTKEGDTVFDPFLGSGTTAYEADRLNRNVIGFDINGSLIKSVKARITSQRDFIELREQDSSEPCTPGLVKTILAEHDKRFVQLAILHPPYHDIIKFTSNPRDLSNAADLNAFIDSLKNVISNTISVLEPNRYFAIIMGDKYSNKQWIPLGFYCMQAAMDVGASLKSIVVKDIQGNRGKRNAQTIWRYRALMNDYYIFKHEYIMVFQNTLRSKIK